MTSINAFNHHEMAHEQPVTTERACEYLSLSPGTLQKFVAEKKIRSHKFNRKVYFFISELQEDLKSR